MPSPIAHLGAGYAIYRYYRQKLPHNQSRFWMSPLSMTLVIGLSMLPDLDVIPALIFTDMKAYHNNVSHSLLSGIPAAFLLAGSFHRIYRSGFWLWFVICLLSYDLHVIMDALTAERGVMMFWPVSQERFTSPIKIFYGVQWGLGWFSLRHLWTVLTELFFALVVVQAIDFVGRRRTQANTVVSQQN